MPQGGTLSECRLVHYPSAGSKKPGLGRRFLPALTLSSFCQGTLVAVLPDKFAAEFGHTLLQTPAIGNGLAQGGDPFLGNIPAMSFTV